MIKIESQHPQDGWGPWDELSHLLAKDSNSSSIRFLPPAVWSLQENEGTVTKFLIRNNIIIVTFFITIIKAFCKSDSKLKVNHKTNLWFFWNFYFPYSPHKFKLFTKIPLIIFSFRKWAFTLSTSSSSNIYKIVIVINTPTTTNLKLLMHLKSIYTSSFLNSYELKTKYLYFLSIFIPKNPDFDTKIFMVHKDIECYDSWWVTFVWAFGCNWLFLIGIHGIKGIIICGIRKIGMINKME